jgi:hypothetical protein
MKINFSKKIFIVSITIFIVVLAMDMVSSYLLINKIIDINNKVKQLNISSQDRLKQLSLNDAISSSVKEREKLTGYFVGPGDLNTVDFTKSLEDLADIMGVTQKKSLAYEEVPGLASAGAVQSIRYKFTVSGKWANVYNFVHAIENLPKISALASVSFIYSAGDKAGAGVWFADLDFSVLKLKN